MNVGPALSPDGKRVVFLSEKDLFSIEMFVYDIESGEIISKLTSTVSDPHFESLQFINSAGIWSPDGSMFALAGVVKGRPAIKILNAENGRRIKEIKFPELGEIFTQCFTLTDTDERRQHCPEGAQHARRACRLSVLNPCNHHLLKRPGSTACRQLQTWCKTRSRYAHRSEHQVRSPAQPAVRDLRLLGSPAG